MHLSYDVVCTVWNVCSKRVGQRVERGLSWPNILFTLLGPAQASFVCLASLGFAVFFLSYFANVIQSTNIFNPAHDLRAILLPCAAGSSSKTPETKAERDSDGKNYCTIWRRLQQMAPKAAVWFTYAQSQPCRFIITWRESVISHLQSLSKT